MKKSKFKEKAWSNYLFLLLSIFLIVGACQMSDERGDEAELKEVKWYYENGNLKKSQQYKGDTSEYGIYKFYYPQGTLKDSGFIVDDQFQGLRYQFFRSGEVESITRYINGNYRHSRNFFPDGGLKKYKAYDYHERLRYYLNYDSSGAPTDGRGDILYSFFLKDTVKKNPYTLQLLVASPPNLNLSINAFDSIKGKPRKVLDISKPNNLNAVTIKNRHLSSDSSFVMIYANLKGADGFLQQDTLIVAFSPSGMNKVLKD